MISDGLYVLEMPPFKAIMLRQNRAVYTISITMIGIRQSHEIML